MLSTQARHPSTALNRCVVFLYLVVFALSCASDSRLVAAIDTQFASLRTAELDVANSIYESTLTQAATDHRAGKLSDDQLARVYTASAELYRAMTIAHAEHKLYLAGG